MDANQFPQIREHLIQNICHLARTKYVYPEQGKKIAAAVEEKYLSGGYDTLLKEEDLAYQLTLDLERISNDQHWHVAYDPLGSPEEVDPEHENDPERMAGYLAKARRENFGFSKVEILEGNIGYISQNLFYPSEYGGETAIAAMNFVANCKALIFDIRANHGGYPSMVQLVISYLYDETPRLLNSLYYRPTNDTQQFWTFPTVPGKRLPQVPVFILTSRETASGAEEFAYNLKHLGRATIIGESTSGMAHPITKEFINDGFSIRIPYGRPINPVTQSDWEETGVIPHIKTHRKTALATAHLKALEVMRETAQNEEEKRSLEWMYEIVAIQYEPITIPVDALEKFIGEYQQREFLVKDGSLYYHHKGLEESWLMTPLSANRFHLDGLMKFDFQLDNKNNFSSIQISYQDRRPDVQLEKI